MKRAGLLAVLAAGSLAHAGTYDPSPATLATIRQNYQEVTALVSAGKLLRLSRVFDCGPALDTSRTVWKDSRGVIRRYTTEGGGEDSAASVTGYYGPDGRLSFALVQAGAVNGTVAETRAYYGPAGNLLKLDEKVVSGPGYPFGPLWQQVVAFPEVAFSAPPPC